MPDWSTFTLGEFVTRLTTRNAVGNENVLTISAQRGLVSQQRYFNKKVASENLSQYYLLERGDFAYNKSYSDGYPVGAIKRLDAHDAGVVSPLYICFRAHRPDVASSDYLVHCFEGGQVESSLRAIAKEGARNHGLLNVKASEFFEISLRLPPLPEQRKIAAILSSVDDAIESTQAVIDQLGVVKKAMMAELLTRGLPGRHTRFKQTEIGEVPEGWGIATIGSVTERIVVGVVVKPASYYAPSGVPALRSKNVRADRLALADLVFFSQASNELLSKSKMRAGDVLTVRTGDPGVSCVVPEYLDGANCIDLILSTPDRRRLLPGFLSRLMNSHIGGASVAMRKGGLAQQHFNVGAMKETLIPVPPIEEQQLIVQTLVSIDAKAAVESELKGGLLQLKSALMSVLLTGEVRVKPDEDAE